MCHEYPMEVEGRYVEEREVRNGEGQRGGTKGGVEKTKEREWEGRE